MAVDTALIVQVDELEKNRDLIRKTIAPNLKADEFDLFMAVCKEVRLNPMTRQIYALSTWDAQLNANKMSIQTSIDGLRLLAERSGDYAGQIGPEWCGKDGVWKDVWVEDTPPVAARVGVLRNSFKQPLYSVAKFSTYARRKRDGKLMYMWESMPDHMLAKCAESLALRRAFPHETHGLYTREEMGQAMAEDDVIEGVVTSSEPIKTEVKEEKPATPAARPAQATNERKPAQEAPKAATEQSAAAPAPRNRAVTSENVPQIPPAVINLKSHAVDAGLVHNHADWRAIKERVLGHPVKDVDLTDEQIKSIQRDIDSKQMAKAS